MKEHNEIDALFESAFDGLTLTPDPSVKENIDQAIASKKKRRRFLFILFPVLFGAVGLAATGYFYSFSGKATQEKTIIASKQNKNETRHSSNQSPRIAATTIKSNQSLQVDTKSKINSKGKIRFAKSNFKTNRSSKASKSNGISTSQFTSHQVQANHETGNSTLNGNDIQATGIPEKPENKNPATQDTITIAETKTDSIPIPSMNLSDSIATLLALSTNCGASSTQAGKWSLTVLSYWEGEQSRKSDLQSEPFAGKKRETASIHSSTFYGKVEINRRLSRRWEVLTGIGFRSSKIIQHGYVDRIEIPLEGLGSGISGTPTVPDTIRYEKTQSFRINSIVLPVGFVYSIPLGTKARIRLAAGADFAYGHFSKQTFQLPLSAPTLRPFGCSVWVRPELYYSFKKMELFGFGTFNQTLSQQLKWNFEVRRNPAFGGGIGLRFSL